MNNLRLLFVLFVPLLGVSCASFQPTTPTTRLCGLYAESQRPNCYEWVKHADEQNFDNPYEAVEFGLAYLHAEYPSLEAAGIVMVDKEEHYFFEFAGVGTQDQVNLLLPPQAIAWMHTHVKGTRQCSVRDQHATLAVNQYLGRRVRSYVQHKHGGVVECEPQRAPQNTPVPKFGRTPID